MSEEEKPKPREIVKIPNDGGHEKLEDVKSRLRKVLEKLEQTKAKK